MALRELFELVGRTRPRDVAWARAKWDGHYHRYLSDEVVGRRFGERCLDVLDRVADGPSGAVTSPEAAEEAAALMEGIVTGRLGPSDVRAQTGVGMEAALILHRLTGGFREAYHEAIAGLPPFSDYHPRYITMGPTGKCNVTCPDCIIGGAIFIKERQLLRGSDDVLPFLAEAESLRVDRVSFCIGEPTYNTRVLFDAFDRIRVSPSLEARSMVTNGLFAKRLDKAVAFFEELRERLGADKARRLMVGVSLNDDLERVGVPVSATANVLEAYGQVFPNHRIVLQIILDAGCHRIQNALFEELGRRGLLPDWEARVLPSEGCHAELRLTSGLRVIVSQMRKQPSLHNPWARPGDDPWVRYYTDEALTSVALKGLYTYEDDEEQEPGEGGLVVHRVTLGPDGVLFPDYHFMVASARPLGTSLASAVASFRQDPILGMLLRRGGINLLLSTYMGIPASERLVADLYEPARRCSTTGMIAANVIFGDDEVALQLLERLLTHGLSAPDIGDREVRPEA
jgi:hypothetical protein